jgi:heme/copper-type cytochrome/quinol oxidase subunit 4
MRPVPDALMALLAANSAHTGRLVVLVAIQAVVALAVFVHATRNGNRHALLWGLASLVFIAAAVIYVSRVWWNRGGKRHFTPR